MSASPEIANRALRRRPFAVSLGVALLAAGAAWGLGWASAVFALGGLALAATAISATLIWRLGARNDPVEAPEAMRSRLASQSMQAADFYWETDRLHRFVDFQTLNPNAPCGQLEHIRGKTRWESLGITDPLSSDLWRPHFETLEAHASFANLEYALTATDEPTVVRVAGAPFFDETGAFEGYRGGAVVLSAKTAFDQNVVESQAAATISDRLLRAVMDQFPATVSIKDTDGRLLLANRRFEEAFNIERSAGVGRRMSEVTSEEIGASVEERDVKVLQSKRAMTLEREMDDGAILEIVKYPVLDTAGECTALVSIGVDVTANREAERKLAEAERRHARIVELLPAGAVYVEDENLHINQAVEKIIGRSRDEVPTLDDWMRLVPRTSGARMRALYERDRDAGFPNVQQFTIERPDGAVRVLEWAACEAGPGEVWLLQDITNNQQADARFRKLFENSAAGHAIIQKTCVVECNVAAAKLLGLNSPEEATGRSLKDFFPDRQPDGVDTYAYLAERLVILKAEGAVQYEFALQRLDGSLIEIEVIANRIDYQDGTAILAEWRDISDRKAYEVELERRREEVDRERRLAVERMNDSTRAIMGWIWETDAEGRFVFLTDSVERAMGRTPEEHYGKTRSELETDWADEDGHSNLDDLQTAVEKRESFMGIEFSRHGPDGFKHWMRASGAPYFDENGAYMGYRGIAFNVDYEKQLEAAQELLGREAAKARRRLEDAIEVLQSGFALFDGEDRLIVCNAALLELLGLNADDVCEGMKFRTIIEKVAGKKGLRASAKQAYLEARMHDHLNDVGTVNRKTASGRWVTSEERRTAEGGVIGSWVDVTDLMEATEAAEAANVAKSEFLAMISHEIRTPMNAVLGMAAVLLQSGMPDEQRQKVETIQRSGAALLSLINDVLDLSKIEAGKVELEQESFDLRDLVGEVLEISAEPAAAKGLTLSAFADKSFPDRLIGDPNRLRQILTNLVANAVKFTGEGGVRVSARALPSDGSGVRRVRLEVVDTGIGIPAEVQERLFQPFIQADASTTRQYGGTGLGLTISRQLAELLGGEIGLESTPGAGSMFWFEAAFDVGPESAETSPPPISLDGAICFVVGVDGLQRDVLIDRVADLGGTPKPIDPDDAMQRFVADGERPECLAVLIASAGWADQAESLAGVIARDWSDVDPIALIRPADIGAAMFRSGVLETGALSWRLFDGAPAETEAPPGAAASPQQEAYGAAQPLRILLVEDNRVNQMVAKAMLQLGDHVVEVAEDGLQAISAVLRRSYDLIFMDMQMPRMDGLDATREIRALDAPASKTPIVAMTANAMEEDKRLCLAAGMDDFLTKPIEHGLLTEMIGKWGGGARDDIAAPSSEPPTAHETAPGEEDAAFDESESVLDKITRDLEAFLPDFEDVSAEDENPDRDARDGSSSSGAAGGDAS